MLASLLGGATNGRNVGRGGGDSIPGAAEISLVQRDILKHISTPIFEESDIFLVRTRTEELNLHTIMEIPRSTTLPIRVASFFRPLMHLTCLALLARTLTAATLPIPNASFETPQAPGAPYYASPLIDFWEETPQPAYYTTNFSTNPWYQMVGEFLNDPGDGAFITNCDGGQAAFLQSLPEVGIFQDYNSFSTLTQFAPSHAFNAIFQPGRSYTLTAGIIGDSPVGLPQGATLQMSLYYRDASNNMVTVASATITNTTSVFPDNLHFVDFSVQVPAVQATNAWAGQNIGIEFLCTVTTNNMGPTTWAASGTWIMCG
jgi:hypothetical protein